MQAKIKISTWHIFFYDIIFLWEMNKREKPVFSFIFCKSKQGIRLFSLFYFFPFLSSIFFNRLLKKFPLLLKIFPITIAWRCCRKETHFSRSSMLISKPYSFIHISSWKRISVKIRKQITDFLTRWREENQILNSEFFYLFYKNFEIISSICSSEKQSSNFISKSF